MRVNREGMTGSPSANLQNTSQKPKIMHCTILTLKSKIKACTHFLVRQDWVALQVSIEECSSRPVVFTKNGAVYIVESVTGDQLVSARRTGEALEQMTEE